MLLVADAWFDVLTSSGSDFPIALTEAYLVELPLAVVCVAAALRRVPARVSDERRVVA